MIYLVLDAFIETTKPKYLAFLIIEISLLIITIILLFLTALIHVLFSLCVCVTLISFFVILITQEIRLRKEVQQRFLNYNENLNKIADVLRSFVFHNENNVSENWYSADRIKYLIKMCDNLVYKNIETKNKNATFFKSAIIAVIGFIAGILAEKASLEINLVIGALALMVVIGIYCLCELGEVFTNIFFKSNSPEEIMRLKSALMDLLLRDFSESAGLELEICEKA